MKTLLTMAPAYKLTYFDARGVGEVSRFLFKYGGIEFEDIRIKRENWSQMKNKTPFGQLPFLEHNGKTVNQSVAIARYLAKIVNLAGNDEWENLEIDAIVDTVNDLRTKIAAVRHELDDSKKKTMKEVILKETIPFYFSRFEKIAEKNKGHLALGRLSWADFYFASFCPIFDLFTESEALAKYPNLKAVRHTVENIPAIKKWIAERPQTVL